MTITELTQKIERIKSRLDAELSTVAEVAGKDLAALVTLRVTQRGQASDGAQFTPYSDTLLPAHFYYDKSRNASGEARVRKAGKEKKKISYKQFRVINGLNAAPKNFEFTGEMWRKFSVLSVSRTAQGVMVTIGGATTDAAKKIADNSKREGKLIVAASDSELATVRGNLNRWAQGVIDNS
jgi:hypothetical protein